MAQSPIHRLPMPLLALLFRIRGRLRSASARRSNVGAGAYIDPTVHVTGWRNVRIGANSVISESTWININNRDVTECAVSIGDNVFIGRRNFFTSGKTIRIGSYVMTSVDCRFLGSGHLFDDPFVPYLVSGTTDDGIIDIGTNVWLGAAVTVLSNVRIGHGSIIGAGSLVNRDVPPFSVCVGSPGRVIKRYSFPLRRWVAAADFRPEDESAVPDEAEYLKRLADKHAVVGPVLLPSSKRFGDY